jgi:hypothetical protein
MLLRVDGSDMLRRVARRSTSMFRSCCTALAPPADVNYDILSKALASEPLRSTSDPLPLVSIGESTGR